MGRRQKGEVGGVGGGRRGGKDASLHNREVRIKKMKWVGGRRVRWEEENRKTRAEDMSRRTS